MQIISLDVGCINFALTYSIIWTFEYINKLYWLFKLESDCFDINLYMDKKRSIAVLFLGSIERTEEYPATERPIDEIDFGKPVRVTLIRIPKAKR